MDTLKEDTLYIDSREPRKLKVKVKEYFDKIDIPTEIKQLSVADYKYNKLSIERKDITDYSSSLKDGRLKSQQFRLLEEAQTKNTHPYIIIQGVYSTLIKQSYRYNNSHVITRKQYYNSIASIVENGIPILHTDGQGHKELSTLIEALIRHYNSERPVLEQPVLKQNKMDWDTTAIYNIKGIGITTARDITEQYSIRDLLTLPSDEISANLTDIDGIGEKTVQRILTHVKGEGS